MIHHYHAVPNQDRAKLWAKIKQLFVIIMITGISYSSHASHLMGGQITFTNTGPNTYHIKQVIYRDCSGIPLNNTTSITISPATPISTISLTRTSITDVSILCPGQVSICAGGAVAGIEEHIFEGNVTLPPIVSGGSYTLTSNLSARNTGITTLVNSSNQNMYITTQLNPNLSQQNNSPDFLTRPIGTFCIGQLSSISPNGFDPDGDALVYSLVPAREGLNNNVNYAGGFSGTVPLSSSTPITINPNTGELSFTPSAIQIAVVCIKAEEFRNGVKIGEIYRDLQIKMVNCSGNNVPVISALPNVVVPVGTPYCVNVNATDADSNNITLTAVSGIIPPASFTITGGGTGFRDGQFCFTPQPSDQGNTYSVSITATDDYCPQPSSTVSTFNITVPAVCNVSIAGTSTSTFCGLNNGTATAALSGGTAPYAYYWTGPGGFTASTDSINNLAAGIYCVTIVDGNNCVDSICFNVALTTVDDNNVCTLDSCFGISGTIHVLIDFNDNDECTIDACDPITGVSHTAVVTDDNDACTTDGCDPLTGVFNNPLVINDNDACTIDACDPITGVSHNAVVTDDNDACTTDGCDPLTGVFHNPIVIDDNDACTIDACNPLPSCTGGIQALDGSNRYFQYATIYDWDCCLFNSGAANFESPYGYPVDGHIKVEYDCNGNGVIIESTGGYAIRPGFTVGSSYNTPFSSVVPSALTATYARLVVDGGCCNSDGSRIYVELTDERFGSPAGVTHTPVQTDDNNVCTTDGCDPVTGVYHNAIDFDDHDACTVDGCDPLTGAYHTPINSDDNNDCTIDACDPVTGVSNTPIVVTAGPISGVTSDCMPTVGGSQTYSVPAVPGATYNWTTPNNMNIVLGQGSNSIFVSLNQGSGKGVIGNLCVEITNGCGSATSCTLIDFSSIKPITPGSISGPVKLCPGDGGVYSVSAVTRASFYNWILPTGMFIVNGANTNVITVTTDNSYAGGTISVASGNVCGTSTPRTRSLSLNLPTVPGAIAGNGTGVCGLTLNYSVASVPNALNYIWTIPSGATLNSANGSNTINVTFNSNFTSGQITVKTENNCGISAVRTLNVIGAPPTPGVFSGPTTVCTGSLMHYSVATVLNASSYTWTAPGIVAIGQGTKEVDVQFGSSPASSQIITVTASNSCGTSGVRILNGISVNFCVRTGLTIGELYIYPNPATNNFIVGIESGSQENGSISIRDITGRLVYSEEVGIVVGLNNFNINANDLSNGIYMVSISMNGAELNSRLLINKD